MKESWFGKWGEGGINGNSKNLGLWWKFKQSRHKLRQKMGNGAKRTVGHLYVSDVFAL